MILTFDVWLDRFWHLTQTISTFVCNDCESPKSLIHLHNINSARTQTLQGVAWIVNFDNFYFLFFHFFIFFGLKGGRDFMCLRGWAVAARGGFWCFVDRSKKNWLATAFIQKMDEIRGFIRNVLKLVCFMLVLAVEWESVKSLNVLPIFQISQVWCFNICLCTRIEPDKSSIINRFSIKSLLPNTF